VRFVNDRLSQFARIAGSQGQPKTGDNLLEITPLLLGVLDMSDPIRRGVQTFAGAAGSVTEPVAESILIQDSYDQVGVQALNSRDIAFFAPGLWHLNIFKQFRFDGTNAPGSLSQLILTSVATDLGSIIFNVLLSQHRYYIGAARDYNRDIWLPMLTTWKLNTISSAMVAGDEIHTMTSIVARRFF